MAAGVSKRLWEIGDIVDMLGAWEQAIETSHAAAWIPMPGSYLNDPEHWRFRAKEARAMAEYMTDPASRQMMLDVAADYERLAARSEERIIKSPPPQSK
jgi:hypothetical protein